MASDAQLPSNPKDVLSELRTLHEEICTSDGGECEMMALVRRGADEIERLRAVISMAPPDIAALAKAPETLPVHCEHDWDYEWSERAAACIKCGAEIPRPAAAALATGSVNQAAPAAIVQQSPMRWLLTPCEAIKDMPCDNCGATAYEHEEPDYNCPIAFQSRGNAKHAQKAEGGGT